MTSKPSEFYVLFAAMLEAVRESLTMTANCVAATAALVGVADERLPGFAARYEELRQRSEATSPEVLKARATCVLIDGLIRKIEDEKAQS
jgi:hypothetical protein